MSRSSVLIKPVVNYLQSIRFVLVLQVLLSDLNEYSSWERTSDWLKKMFGVSESVAVALAVVYHCFIPSGACL